MSGHKILHKRNSIEEKIPTANDLELGELAINTFDGNIFLKKEDNSIFEMKRLDSRLNDINIVDSIYNDNGDLIEILYASGNKVQFNYSNDNIISSYYFATDGETHLYTLEMNYNSSGDLVSTNWIKE